MNDCKLILKQRIFWTSSFLGLMPRRAMSLELESGLRVRVFKPMTSLFPQTVILYRGKGRARINPLESAFVIQLPKTENDWLQLKALVKSGGQRKVGRPFWVVSKEMGTITGDRGGDFKITLDEFIEIENAIEKFEAIWRAD